MATINAIPAAAGTLVAYTAAAGGGDTIAAGTAQRTTLIVRNASGSSMTTTLTAVNACSQGFLHNTAVTCAVGDTEVAIPPACVSAAGNTGLTYSLATSVSIAAVTT